MGAYRQIKAEPLAFSADSFAGQEILREAEAVGEFDVDTGSTWSASSRRYLDLWHSPAI